MQAIACLPEERAAALSRVAEQERIEELRLRCVETMVCVRLDTKGNFVSSPIPDEIRERMMPYVCEDGDERLTFRS